MEDKNYMNLTSIRMARADELLSEAKNLLSDGAYKSANNRAYYAIEKAVNALLISKHVETQTHNGTLKMFNIEFVRAESAFFTHDDYKLVAGAERIRNSSDYDDFYVASKEECMSQVESAEVFLNKVKKYFAAQ